MSHRVLVEIALKRREVFRRLPDYLRIIKDVVRKLDPKAEVYMFGSVAEENYNYSSDIDILIITRVQPAEVHLELWKAGVKDPFEVHVQMPDGALFCKKEQNLLRFRGFMFIGFLLFSSLVIC